MNTWNTHTQCVSCVKLGTTERVARFIDLRLKSDTETAVIAFRNCVVDMCKADVTTEDATKGDKPSDALIENTVMLPRGIIRTIKCHTDSTQVEVREDSPSLSWLVEYAGGILSSCQKGRDEITPFERLYGKQLSHEFVPFSEKVLARHISTHPMNRMNSRNRYGIWPGNEKPQRRMFHWICGRCVQSSRNQKAAATEQLGQRDHQQCDWSAVAVDKKAGEQCTNQ